MQAGRRNICVFLTPMSGRSRSNLIFQMKVLFLSDIFPIGYMAAENAEIEPGDTVAVWGCGPVAQEPSSYPLESSFVFFVLHYP
jgi:hypothetical protein